MCRRSIVTLHLHALPTVQADPSDAMPTQMSEPYRSVLCIVCAMMETRNMADVGLYGRISSPGMMFCSCIPDDPTQQSPAQCSATSGPH